MGAYTIVTTFGSINTIEGIEERLRPVYETVHDFYNSLFKYRYKQYLLFKDKEIPPSFYSSEKYEEIVRGTVKKARHIYGEDKIRKSASFGYILPDVKFKKYQGEIYACDVTAQQKFYKFFIPDFLKGFKKEDIVSDDEGRLIIECDIKTLESKDRNFSDELKNMVIQSTLKNMGSKKGILQIIIDHEIATIEEILEKIK